MAAGNTENSNKKAENAFITFLRFINIENAENYYDFDLPILNGLLKQFWFDARKVDSSKYRVSSLENFRHGLNRCLKAHGCKFDLIKSPEFQESSESYKNAVKELKIEGHGYVDETPEICGTGKHSLVSIDLCHTM